MQIFIFQWQPVQTQRFSAPSALLPSFSLPWVGASELLGTESLGLLVSVNVSRVFAILAMLGTVGWRGIFCPGFFPCKVAGSIVLSGWPVAQLSSYALKVESYF